MSLDDEIALGKNQRNRFALYGAGFAKARIENGSGQRSFEIEMVESHSIILFHARKGKADHRVPAG